MKRLLISNRGEIARRVIRTAHRMGIDTVAVFSEPDADGASVELGPQELRTSWVAERLAEAGGVIGKDPGSGRLIHRYTAIIVAWDEPAPAEVNVFFLEADGRHVAALD
ncbi:MAG: biotin carboxylase N-terminal domain-containing protein, partial [Hydrogenophaga sp.]